MEGPERGLDGLVFTKVAPQASVTYMLSSLTFSAYVGSRTVGNNTFGLESGISVAVAER